MRKSILIIICLLMLAGCTIFLATVCVSLNKRVVSLEEMRRVLNVDTTVRQVQAADAIWGYHMQQEIQSAERREYMDRFLGSGNTSPRK